MACFFRLKGQQLPEKLSRELGSKLRQLAQGWTKRCQLSLQRQVIQLKTLAPQAAADSRVRHLARLATLGRHLQGLAGVRAGGLPWMRQMAGCRCRRAWRSAGRSTGVEVAGVVEDE